MRQKFISGAPALRYRDFRFLWIGLLVSITGSMMQSAAILWHIYDLSGSAVALGGIGLVRVLPILFFSLLSGVVADSFDRRKVMMIAQGGMALCGIGLGCVALADVKSIWPIYILAGLSSSFGAFDLPARQSLIPLLVPKKDLPNAFSLMATAFQAASIGGPALAGIVIAERGLAAVYWLNAISFGAVVAALLLVRTRTAPSGGRLQINRSAIREGLRFVRDTPVILSSMLLDFFATFFSSATALLPIFAKDILHVGATGYGWLYAAAAVGALLTGIVMSFLSDLPRQGPTLIVSVSIYGLATILFGLAGSFWMAFLALALTGIGDTVSMIIRNTIRQLNTPDSLRGRMVSVNMIFFMGGPQLGELEAGLVAALAGARISVISGGIGCLLAVCWVLWKWPLLWKYDRSAPLYMEQISSAGLRARDQASK